TAEDAYCQFMLAELTGDETEIRKLIVANADAAILWKGGAYPKDVAALLSEQYRTMEISRAEADGDGDSKRVRLTSSAFPLPLTVEYVAGTWKVDVAPLIEIRKANSRNQKPHNKDQFAGERDFDMNTKMFKDDGQFLWTFEQDGFL